LEDLSLRKFQRIWEKNLLSELVISGEPTETELNEAWFQIYDEFIAITGDNSNALRLSTVKRIAVNKSKLGYISSALQFAVMFPDPEIIDILKAEGFNYDPADRIGSIEGAKRKLYKMKQSVDLAENEIKINTNNKAPDLEELIIDLEKYQGYQFNRDTMNARTFATIYKNYKNVRRQN
jgi:hypothetical protein